ncbi:Uncharacterised protein [Mycobacteroides abscessus subsp. abscessus]|nr:Uncharacterised protein [Mycobacteroides abscessus subsp. abscessus]
MSSGTGAESTVWPTAASASATTSGSVSTVAPESIS